MIQAVKQDDWRELGAVTLAQAARIAGRSYSWARDRAVDGSLDAIELPTGPLVVTTASLDALLLRQRRASRSNMKRGCHLRLVVNND